MVRTLLHVDIDAFLASVEQLRDPALFGRPVAVGTGVVASRSYEAKVRGVATAMPLHEALRRCPELVVRPGDARLAERYRQRTAEVLREFAPQVEVCSLDDFYVELTGAAALCVAGADPAVAVLALCRELRDRVRAATGLSVAQGVGPTRTVAALATSRAKPGGICIVPAGREPAFLAEFPVVDLPGVGPSTQALLAAVGVTQVRELWAFDRNVLQQSLGARGDELWLRAHGRDDAPLRSEALPQSISRETSFEPRGDLAAQERPFLRAMLAYLVDRAAAELRRQRLLARRVQVRVDGIDGVRGERTQALGVATDRTDLLWGAAQALLEGLLERRALVRRVGTALLGLERCGIAQGELFAAEDQARRRLGAAVDALRARHGFGSILGQGVGALLGQVPTGRHGFVLRTPSLTR